MDDFPEHLDPQLEAIAELEAAFAQHIPLPDPVAQDATCLLDAIDLILSARMVREAHIEQVIEQSVHAFGRIEPVFVQRLALERTATESFLEVRQRIAQYAEHLHEEDLMRLSMLPKRFADGDGSAALEGMALVIIGRARCGEYTSDVASALIAALRLSIRAQQNLAQTTADALTRIGTSDRPSAGELARIQRASREFDEVALVGASLANVATGIDSQSAATVRIVVDTALAGGDVRVAALSLAQIAERARGVA